LLVLAQRKMAGVRDLQIGWVCSNSLNAECVNCQPNKIAYLAIFWYLAANLVTSFVIVRGTHSAFVNEFLKGQAIIANGVRLVCE
ncbi:MAG: hypothetical protein KTR17_09335, partial [Cellvibrionaceae bacterium]|nr:hypothetical protein [Cellvibrionaceae bacterium]